MDRIELINTLIRLRAYRDYLEIGVKGGKAFLAVDVERKTGVDPDLHRLKQQLQTGWQGRFKRALQGAFGAPWTLEENGLRLFEMPSDDYFAERDDRYDIVFIDGLHHFDQVLRDYANAQRALRDGGCVVFHDCNPLCERAAQRDREPDNQTWNGDTWKAVYGLRRRGQEIWAYDFDEGCGVAFKQKPPPPISEREIQELMELPYDALDRDRASAVGLREWNEKDLSAV
jgi:SAM-dependent methyltransferase